MDERNDVRTSGLQRISEMKGYDVSPEDPDIRGWNVVSADGQVIGKVDDLFVDTAQMKVRQIDVDLKGGDHTSLPAEQAQVDRQRHEVRFPAYGMTGQAASSALNRTDFDRERAYGATARSADDRIPRSGRTDDTERRITRSEEELQIGKREVSHGDAVVGKHVETEHVSQPVTLNREELVVERRPLSGDVRGAEIRDDEVHIPLHEEEAVVEKRTVPKEEIVIGKRTVADTKNVEAEVRKERFDVEQSTGRRSDREK